jgi:hypothetical protein
MSRNRLQLAALLFLVAGSAGRMTAAPRSVGSTTLWPGSKFTVADRDSAVERGLRFIYSIAKDPTAFRQYGSDLLFAFVNISSSNGNNRVAQLAREMGHERAVEWRRQHRTVPRRVNPGTIAELIYGSYSANRLGATDRVFDRELQSQAKQVSPRDYLGFDPSREPPPANYPGYSRYALFMDAMISTYFGEQFGSALEGRYYDVLRWLPQMRPYPAHRYGDWDYYDAVYAITHVIYTFNHYNLYKVSPACFPEEFDYLRSNLGAAIADHDPETLGEYVDSLRAFGMDYSDVRLREATDYLLSAQNQDGSWGDPADTDAYSRYHTTWTGQGALQEFRWTKTLPCPGP